MDLTSLTIPLAPPTNSRAIPRPQSRLRSLGSAMQPTAHSGYRSKETSVMNSLPRSLGTGVSDGAASRLLSRVDAPIEEATGLPNLGDTDDRVCAIERETEVG